MKIHTFVGVALVFLILGKFFEIIELRGFIIFILAFVWFIMFYWSVRQKNKERNIPKPVYISEPAS